jgi:hypothetical protein
MKKDLNIEPVTGVQVAIARKPNQAGGFEWHVYLINKNLIELHTVLIVSKGYGEKRQTSLLRHGIEVLKEQSVAVIEAIDPSVFQLSNEFWVSYYILDKIFDKKFVFPAHSIAEANVRMIPELGLEGIMHA